jgi:hypothetical protein
MCTSKIVMHVSRIVDGLTDHGWDFDIILKLRVDLAQPYLACKVKIVLTFFFWQKNSLINIYSYNFITYVRLLTCTNGGS